MDDLVRKIIDFIEEKQRGGWNPSDTFIHILNSVKAILKDKHSESRYKKVTAQSKLFTHIQNAYLGRGRYVKEDDMEKLATIWGELIRWLLFEVEVDVDGDKGSVLGLINATATPTHDSIVKLCRDMNAITIITPAYK